MVNITKVTLDHNCIVAIEKNEPLASALETLIQANNNGLIHLQIPGIFASERQIGGTYFSSFEEFKHKLRSIGLTEIDILAPIAYWDVTYWDHVIWADDEMLDLERKIHSTMFPQRSLSYGDAKKTHYKTWRNTKCDVMALWCHIHYGGHIFVTADNDFHTKREELINLGAGDIQEPMEAVIRLNL